MSAAKVKAEGLIKENAVGAFTHFMIFVFACLDMIFRLLGLDMVYLIYTCSRKNQQGRGGAKRRERRKGRK